MIKKIADKYYFSAFPLVIGMIFLGLIGFQYLGLAISPYALENIELTKKQLRQTPENQKKIIAGNERKAKIIGFANFLPKPFNQVVFAAIPLACFTWLFLLFRKFGKDGIALQIKDDELIIRTYKGPVHLPREQIEKIILESPSELKFVTHTGHCFLSTTTVRGTRAPTLKRNLEAWTTLNYELIPALDSNDLAPMNKIPDIHN